MSEREPTFDPADGPLLSPWPILGIGLGLVVLGWGWGLAFDTNAPVLRLLTLTLGLIGVGSALALYLPHAERSLEGRLISGGLWVLGAAATYVARIGLGTQFDSLHILLFVLTLAAIAGAILTALPPGWRILGASALVLLHFAAILTAVTVVPPPEGASPYLANHLWHKARPYLQVTVLNNGYHFYAPEPGPAQLLWFRVEFEDGASMWVRIPDHKKVAHHIERRRLGSLATSSAQTVPTAPDRLEKLRLERFRAAQATGIPMSDLPPAGQYREPSQYAMHLLSSFVRRVVNTAEHPDGGDVAVKAVKVYRADYNNPPVQHFQAGRDPLDPTLYQAFYMGEYQPDGTLMKSSLRFEEAKPGEAPERVQDPFLYWQLPIIRVPDDEAAPDGAPKQKQSDPTPWQSEGRIINFVRIHAGDRKDQESIP